MTPSALTTAGRLATLLRTALIAGGVVAVLSYPLAAMAGLGARAASDTFDRMPDTLAIVPPPQTTYVYADDGKTLITAFYEENRRATALADMSPWIPKAIVAAEDSRFYQHHGVDLRGTLRAFVANQQAGTVAQGASTLTMQYVRNMLQDTADTPQQAVDVTEQSTARKVREMKLAIDLEKTMTKDQILEGYLNLAYFGHQAYGIEAAARTYFDTSPTDLTPAQAALIAGLVQAPSAYDPVVDPGAARRRRDYVIDRMAALGYLSAAEAGQAKAAPITLHVTDQPNDCVSVPAAHNDWGFFCDEFTQWWMSQPAFGATPQDRLENLRRGGYTVVTSLDPGTQAAAMRHTLAEAAPGDRYALGSVFIQPGTGLIKAMAVNRIHSLDQSHNGPNSDPAKRAAGTPGSYPDTVTMLLGGGPLEGYQGGSTFKLFTMLAALEKGMTLNTAIYSPARLITPYPAGPGPASCGGLWCPANDSAAMTGVHTMWSGWGESVNTYWVQVEERVGAQNAVAMATRLGLAWHTDVDRALAQPGRAGGWGAFTLGVADTTPLEMAAAYATVAADGRYCQPLPVLSITGPDGKPALTAGGDGTRVPVASPRCHQVVSPDVARGAVDAMRCATGYGAATGPCGGWSTAPDAYAKAGRPLAGKTGTTDGTRSAWFVGITPQLAGASCLADPDNPFDVAGGGQSGKPVDTVALTIRDALAGDPVRTFTPPPPDITGRPRQAAVPGRS